MSVTIETDVVQVIVEANPTHEIVEVVERGANAYELAVRYGYEGTLEAWLEALTLPVVATELAVHTIAEDTLTLDLSTLFAVVPPTTDEFEIAVNGFTLAPSDDYTYSAPTITFDVELLEGAIVLVRRYGTVPSWAGNEVRTDEAVVCTNTPSGVTNYAVPVRDAGGTLLGYLPLYAAPW